ncbi:MAG: flippase-like domain-containing protein [Myxococcales bacterium]|nr:flippase-like domain-containing protein [Myxococcales bacterium]
MKASLKRYAPLLLRLAAVGVLAWWLLSSGGLGELVGAVRRIPLVAWLGAVALVCTAIALSTWRWRMLMRAFGATAIPPLGTLVRLVFVGMFYNNFVPGTVGGDLVRGVVSRRCFAEPAASLVVVLLDRVIGLSALGVIFLASVPFGPRLIDPAQAAPWIAALIGVGVIGLVGARMSGLLARWWQRVPTVRAPRQLLSAFGLSFVCHAFTLSAFVVLALGLALPVSVGELLVVIPLGLVASIVPIAIAGIGPREAALVGLMGLVGVEKAPALALSLGYAAAALSAGALGGVLQLVGGKLAIDVEALQAEAAEGSAAEEGGRAGPAATSPASGDTTRSS